MSPTGMKVERAFRAFWRFFIEYWNAIVATVATVGYLVSSLIPEKGHAAFYLDLGMAAILFTLVEIKFRIQDRRRVSSQFKNLRAAAPTIVSAMRHEMERDHHGILEIQVFASQLLSAGDIVREILVAVQLRSLRTHNVKFTIYCLDPQFVSSCPNPRLPTRYSANILQVVEELEAFNSDKIFKSDNVKVEVIKYQAFPFLYAFLVGDTNLYFGPITWSDQRGDFVGAQNSCYELRRSDPAFQELKQFLENRGMFYRRCSTARKIQVPIQAQ